MEKYDMEQVMTWMEDFFALVQETAEHMKEPHDYGTGDVLNMVEMHTLAMIADQPGLKVSDVAALWGRTLGAASRNVDRLQAKGWVEKTKLPDNRKNVRLYPTEKGKELARLHREYDLREMEQYTEAMLRRFSMEELTRFFEVLHALREVLTEK